MPSNMILGSIVFLLLAIFNPKYIFVPLIYIVSYTIMFLGFINFMMQKWLATSYPDTEFFEDPGEDDPYDF